MHVAKSQEKYSIQYVLCPILVLYDDHIKQLDKLTGGMTGGETVGVIGPGAGAIAGGGVLTSFGGGGLSFFVCIDALFSSGSLRLNTVQDVQESTTHTTRRLCSKSFSQITKTV